MALTTLRPDAELVTSLLDEMLTYLNPDGTFQVGLIVSDAPLDDAKKMKTLY